RSLFRSTDIEAQRTLLTLDAIDSSAGDQIAVELDCASSIVVARDREVNNVWIAVRVNDCNNRNTKAASFLNGNRFLVGVNDEHQVRRGAHVADTTESALKLFTLTLEVQTLLLGEALCFAC